MGGVPGGLMTNAAMISPDDNWEEIESTHPKEGDSVMPDSFRIVDERMAAERAVCARHTP